MLKSAVWESVARIGVFEIFSMILGLSSRAFEGSVFWGWVIIIPRQGMFLDFRASRLRRVWLIVPTLLAATRRVGRFSSETMSMIRSFSA